MIKAIWTNLKRAWPVYLTLVAVLVGGQWWLSRQDPVQSPILPAAAVNMEPHIELQFKGVQMQGREKGTVRWAITADEVSSSQNQQFVYFDKKPRGTFFNLKNWEQTPGATASNRKVDWVADKAEYDSLSEAMTIKGNAVFTTDEQDVIKTDEVFYSARLKEVRMPKPVELVSHRGTTIKANQATADIEIEAVDLKGNVELTSPLNSQEGL